VEIIGMPDTRSIEGAYKGGGSDLG